MPRRSTRVAALVVSAALAGCSAPPAKPLVEPLAISVTSADSTRAVRFTVDVTGGQAVFRTPGFRGRAAEPRLTASTPAELVLGPGTTGASFRALDGARLEVAAVAPRARLVADGARVRIASTDAGLSIRDY